MNSSVANFPFATISVAPDRSSASVLSPSIFMPGCSTTLICRPLAGNHIFFRCNSPVKLGLNKFTGLNVGASSIDISTTDVAMFTNQLFRYDCSRTIDRCFGIYYGSGTDKRIEVFGHDGVSAYRYASSFF